MCKPNPKFLMLEKDVTLNLEFYFSLRALVSFWSKIPVIIAEDKIQKFQRFKELRRKSSAQSWSVACWWPPGECNRCGWRREEAAGGHYFNDSIVFLYEGQNWQRTLCSEEFILCCLVFFPEWLSVQLDMTAHACMHLTQNIQLSPTLGNEIWLEPFQWLLKNGNWLETRWIWQKKSIWWPLIEPSLSRAFSTSKSLTVSR